MYVFPHTSELLMRRMFLWPTFAAWVPITKAVWRKTALVIPNSMNLVMELLESASMVGMLCNLNDYGSR